MCFCAVKYSELALEFFKQNTYEANVPLVRLASMRKIHKASYNINSGTEDEETAQASTDKVTISPVFNEQKKVSTFIIADAPFPGICDIPQERIPDQTAIEDKLAEFKIPQVKIEQANTTQKGAKRIRVASADPNTTLLINPDCFVKILMDYIYETLNLKESEINLDFCDDDGQMIELFKLKPYESALLKMGIRKQYYLVQYELSEDNSYKFIEPLIKRSNKHDSEIIRKLMKTLPCKSNSFAFGRGITRNSSKKRSKGMSINVHKFS